LNPSIPAASSTPQTAAPLQLYLIRHGETEWSRSGRHTGRTDIALTEQGQRMARDLARPLADVDFSTVLTSPRRRAQDTCALAGLGARATVEPDLAEWDYGDDEGRRSVEIAADRPGWDIWRDGCPGGESPAAVSARADRLVERLRGLGGNVALFTHGHFGRVLTTRWLGQPITLGQHLILDPATIGLLGIDARHGQTPVILRWNASL
jgi:broad specificity phosphatase PhoE